MSTYESHDPGPKERADAVAYARATLRAEGLELSHDAVQDGDNYAAGLITLDELEKRAHQRARELADRDADSRS